MPITEPVIRPPAEAGSFYLQITEGCSANHCTFCGAYADKPFRIKDDGEISGDIEAGRRMHAGARRVFLMDGDALVVKNGRLLPILRKLNEAFPALTRISSYANGYNITQRSSEELRELHRHKLRLIYIGLESGSQKILDMRRKRSGADEMVKAVKIAEEAGIRSSVIVLLGLGGREHSGEHVAETVKALNRMQPRYLSFLSVMLIPGTPLYNERISGIFEELDQKGLLREMHDIIKGLELKMTVFRSDHASNYLPLEGRFPNDKDRLLEILSSAGRGRVELRPEFMRGL